MFCLREIYVRLDFSGQLPIYFASKIDDLQNSQTNNTLIETFVINNGDTIQRGCSNNRTLSLIFFNELKS